MRVSAIALVAIITAGCNARPSSWSASPRHDPWDGPAANAHQVSAGQRASEDDHDVDNDVTQLGPLLEKIGDNLKKPGPYEAATSSAGFKPDGPHWAVWQLSGTISERETLRFTTRDTSLELARVRARLLELGKDPHLTGVLLRIGDLDISLPDATELRDGFAAFRATGKRLACHAENLSNVTYVTLTACDEIALAPLGEVAITGPAAMPLHLKPLLDRFAIRADFIHVGAYKGAAEPLTLEAPSAEMRETLGAILDEHHATMIETIAAARKLAPATVAALIDEGLHPAPAALTAKLVDSVDSFETYRDRITAHQWTRVTLTDETLMGSLQQMRSMMQFVGMIPALRPTHPHVAIVYAIGDIVDGAGDGPRGATEQIAAHTLIAALSVLANDDTVKAVVLRIDSGGGSAQASELIWRAMATLRAKKPVVVSMSDVAASGGYYIAAGANKIFAQRNTLTGSIGVVGGRIALGEALSAQGVKTYPMGRGKRATMMRSLTPWNAEERALIAKSMAAVYEVFVGRVAEGRHKTPAEVAPLAQGRVWTGAKAVNLGLVDALGGLDDALAEARKLGNVPADAEVEVYPGKPTLRDLLAGLGEVTMGPRTMQTALGQQPLTAAVLAVLTELDPALAAAAQNSLQSLMSFRRTTIQTRAWPVLLH